MLHHALVRGGALLAYIAVLPVGAAAAQDRAGREPVAEGFRIEAFVGADTDGFERGAVYGGRIGYDVAVANSFLLGVDAELNDVTTEQDFLGSPIVLEDGPDFYVGGRIGLRLSRRFSVFGGLGYTRARQGLFFPIDPSQPQGAIGGEESYRDGFRTTVGAQLGIGRRAFVGAEYRYSDYGDRFLRRGQLVASIGVRF